MHMIRHHHKFIHHGMREMVRDRQPARSKNMPHVTQPHLAIHNASKQTCPILRHDGDEIRPRLGVVVPFQADGTTVMLLEVIPHGYTLLAFSGCARTGTAFALCTGCISKVAT